VLTALLINWGAGFWWLLDDIPFHIGVFLLVLSWTFTLNNLPKKGFRFLKEPLVMFVNLPLSLISSIGFIYGYWFY